MQRNQEISVEALHVITPRLYDIDMSDKYLFFYIFLCLVRPEVALQSYFDLTKQLGRAGGRNSSAKEFGVFRGCLVRI